MKPFTLGACLAEICYIHQLQKYGLVCEDLYDKNQNHQIISLVNCRGRFIACPCLQLLATLKLKTPSKRI